MPTKRNEDERAPVDPALPRSDRPQANSSPRPRVFILSDVRLYCEGLSLSLARAKEIELVGAGAPPNALAQIAERQADVVVADASLVGR